MNSRNKQRFASPGVLTESTMVLGATAKQWDEALTGDFVATLETYRARANHDTDAANAICPKQD